MQPGQKVVRTMPRSSPLVVFVFVLFGGMVRDIGKPGNEALN